jgi:hypothetical protein
MYRDAQQLHFVSRPHFHARAVSTSHQDLLLMVLASTIIVLWIVYLSALTGSILPKLNCHAASDVQQDNQSSA